MLDKGRPETKVETEYTAAAADDDYDAYEEDEEGLDMVEKVKTKRALEYQERSPPQ